MLGHWSAIADTTAPVRGSPDAKPSSVRQPVASPTRYGDALDVGLGTVAEGRAEPSWLTRALHPRGGHATLSAEVPTAFNSLLRSRKCQDLWFLGALTRPKKL